MVVMSPVCAPRGRTRTVVLRPTIQGEMVPTARSSSTPAFYPANPQTISLWGGKLILPRGQIQNLITIRISATGDLEAYENQHATAEAVFANLPDAHHVKALPKEVRVPGAENDALRELHGVIPLSFSDLPNSGGKKDFLGYAFCGGSTMWFFIMNSAAQGNLPPWPEDPTRQERNAFTELVAGTAVALYDGGSHNLALRFALWSRMERDELFGARLRAVVKDRPGMTLWDGDRQVDLHDPTAQIINAVSSGQTNAAILDLKGALYNGNLNHLAANKWEKPEAVLPLGYRFRREVNAEGVTTIVKGEVVADITHRAALQELAEMASAGSTWNAVGRRAAELEVPLRNLAGRGKSFASLHEYALSRAAKILLGNPTYISLWRTGTMVVRRNSPVEGALKIRGHQLSFDEGATVGHVDTQVTWPLPDGGWGVADEVWDRLLDRLDREADRAARIKTSAGMSTSDIARRAFSGSPTWAIGDYEYRLVPDSPTAYHLRRRDAKDGRDSEGRPRGWIYAEGEALATFHSLALHASVSLALEAALTKLADTDTVVGTIPVTTPNTRRHVEYEKLVSNLTSAADELDQTALAFDELAVKAQMLGREAQVDAYIEHAATHRADAQAKREEADRLRAVSESEPDIDSVEPVVLDLSSPAVVAVALRRFPQHVPASLVDSLVTLGITESLRVELSNDESMGHWSATCRVPVIGENEIAVIEISGVVPNSAPPPGARFGERRSFTESVVRQFLVEQMDLNAIAATHHRKAAWVRKQVHGWLRSHGVTANGLAAAAMQCPIEETRRAIYVACSGDASTVADLAPAFVEHVKKTYLGTKGMTNWIPGSMRGQRQLLATLVTTSNGSAIKHDIAASMGLTARDVAAIARGWSKIGSVVERVGFQEMRLRRCPHPDCSGHPGYLAQYLVTPETPDGLLCTSCRRTPESADVVYPADYLLPWEGPDVHLGETPSPVTVESTQLLTVREAANLLGWSDYLVHKYLPVARHVGKMAYFHPADVDAKYRVAKSLEGRRHATRTIGEVAQQLGVSPDTIRALANAGVIPDGRVVPGRGWRRFTDDEVEVIRQTLVPADHADTELLGTADAAARLGISSVALRAAARRGLVQSQRTSSGAYRFAPNDLEAFAHSRSGTHG